MKLTHLHGAKWAEWADTGRTLECQQIFQAHTPGPPVQQAGGPLAVLLAFRKGQ